MSANKKSQRTFMTVTMITIVAMTTVFIVYAALLLTLTGTTVTVNQEAGSVQYNLSDTSNATWTGSLQAINTGTEWYARINITDAAAQAVTISWVLQQNTGTWVDVNTPVTTTMTLAAGSNTIYATTDGLFSGNFDWGSLTTSAGSFRVEARVNG